MGDQRNNAGAKMAQHYRFPSELEDVFKSEVSLSNEVGIDGEAGKAQIALTRGTAISRDPQFNEPKKYNAHYTQL